MPNNKSVFPFCARCQKPVDSLTQYFDTARGDYEFTAICHGQKEVTIIKCHELRGGIIAVNGGTAFNAATVAICEVSHERLPY